MRAINLHLKILIFVLVSLGVAITAYQILYLGIPVSEAETDNLWNIDTKIEFQASSKDPVKIKMYSAAEQGIRQSQRELHQQ